MFSLSHPPSLPPFLPLSLPPFPPFSDGILQPQLKKKRTVATPKSKHFRAKKKDMYCLQHQEEDSEGDIKTELYKVSLGRREGGKEGGNLSSGIFHRDLCLYMCIYIIRTYIPAHVEF